MSTLSVFNFRASGLIATLAVGAILLVNATAQAEQPDPLNQITVTSRSVKTIGRDPATDAPIKEITRTAYVQYDPVVLTTNSGVALLKDSVQDAAVKICASLDPLDSDDGGCIRRTVESAKPQIDAAIASARRAASAN